MTHVYFVRHAQSDTCVRDDRIRPLTEKGQRDCSLVTAYLKDKDIVSVLSSPYRRAADTVQGIAQHAGLPVVHVEAFRERRITEGWIEDFADYARRQWADFSYALPGGECLAEVQGRNVRALRQLLKTYEGRAVAIGAHGTALSTVIHHYNPAFSYDDFNAIAGLMPWIVHFTFCGERCLAMEPVDVFRQTPSQA